MLITKVTDSPLFTLLANLGSTADEVAATIKAHGIQGIRNTVRFLNPLIRYLQTQMQLNPLTMDLILGDRLRMRHDNGTQEETPIPQAVLQFLDAFNQGVYPELVIS